MRSITLLLAVAVTSTGCLHRIVLPPDQQCADADMEAADVQEISSRKALCKAPAPDEKTQCVISALKRVNEPVNHFNATVPAKAVIMYIGYILVVPGLVLNIIFDNDRTNVKGEMVTLRDQEIEACTESKPSS